MVATPDVDEDASTATALRLATQSALGELQDEGAAAGYRARKCSRLEDFRRCLMRCAHLASARCTRDGDGDQNRGVQGLDVLVRRAGTSGDYILVHHVVPWA